MLCLTSSCSSSGASESGKKGKLLAEVHDRQLYLSEVDFPTSSTLSKKDSAVIIQAHVEKWIRNAILLHHVENKTSDNPRIQKLVGDYSNSLKINFFKEEYIKEHLDSNVNKVDLLNFYSKNNSGFKLDKSIIKLLYFKIKEDKKGLDRFYENWKGDKIQKILRYGKLNSDKHYSDYAKWYVFDEIIKDLPKFMVKKKKKYKNQINKDGFEYFLNVIETRDKNEEIPFELVEEQIKNIVLKKKSSELVDEYIERLYKSEINKNVKTYIK